MLNQLSDSSSSSRRSSSSSSSTRSRSVKDKVQFGLGWALHQDTNSQQSTVHICVW
jgi:hypothetical protein